MTVIRAATINDLDILLVVGKETFLETFAASNTAENMSKYLEENFNPAKVAAELNNPHSLFFIAWEDKYPIGYLKLNSGDAQTELQDDASIEIERIYVRGSHQGKKIGQHLYQKAIEIAMLQNKTYIWLAVWEENHRAIQFYLKNGFTVFDKHIFKLGDDEQTDMMMKKIMNSPG